LIIEEKNKVIQAYHNGPKRPIMFLVKEFEKTSFSKYLLGSYAHVIDIRRESVV
jgi:hypothetical protein